MSSRPAQVAGIGPSYRRFTEEWTSHRHIVSSLRPSWDAVMLKTTLPLTLVLLVCLGTCSLAPAQNDGRIHLLSAVVQGPDTRNVPVGTQEQVDRERVQKAYELRQAEIRRDTEKQFQLSTELKQYIDTSDLNILSVDMVKKAGEIEKLAHGVKQKMKDNR